MRVSLFFKKVIKDCIYEKNNECDYKDKESGLSLVCKNRKKCITTKRDRHLK